MVLLFWCWLTQVVLKKPLNECSSSSSSSSKYYFSFQQKYRQMNWSRCFVPPCMLTYLHERPHRNRCPAWTAGKGGTQTWDPRLATDLHLHSADALWLSARSETKQFTNTHKCICICSVTMPTSIRAFTCNSSEQSTLSFWLANPAESINNCSSVWHALVDQVHSMNAQTFAYRRLG